MSKSGATRTTPCVSVPDGWQRVTVVHDAYSYIVGNEQKGIIVGEGIYQGSTRAFAMEITLQVPEPQIYVMLGVGLIAIGVLRLRRLHTEGLGARPDPQAASLWCPARRSANLTLPRHAACLCRRQSDAAARTCSS
jgi:hypothetical protein